MSRCLSLTLFLSSQHSFFAMCSAALLQPRGKSMQTCKRLKKQRWGSCRPSSSLSVMLLFFHPPTKTENQVTSSDHITDTSARLSWRSSNLTLFNNDKSLPLPSCKWQKFWSFGAFQTLASWSFTVWIYQLNRSHRNLWVSSSCSKWLAHIAFPKPLWITGYDNKLLRVLWLNGFLSLSFKNQSRAALVGRNPSPGVHSKGQQQNTAH